LVTESQRLKISGSYFDGIGSASVETVTCRLWWNIEIYGVWSCLPD